MILLSLDSHGSLWCFVSKCPDTIFQLSWLSILCKTLYICMYQFVTSELFGLPMLCMTSVVFTIWQILLDKFCARIFKWLICYERAFLAMTLYLAIKCIIISEIYYLCVLCKIFVNRLRIICWSSCLCNILYIGILSIGRLLLLCKILYVGEYLSCHQ